MIKQIKKTFELSEDIVNIIKGMSEYFEMTEKEIIELAISQPKIYGSSLKIYNSIKGKDLNI